MKSKYTTFLITAFFSLSLYNCNFQESQIQSGIKSEAVYLDSLGVIRWTDTHEEIALFGANYCLPSACDYRAAGYTGGNKKEMIDQDLTHFSRMGFDGLRLCFWGDWENTDNEGNLIENDHLDLLDYLIFKATQKGIYMLFSPIVTYSSQWPDKQNDTLNLGFSFHFEKWDLGSDPDAIRAQVNYLKQILDHVNPYSGHAYKEEPNIIIIEPINEPSHHFNDIPGSIKYMNTLYDAIRETGCEKLVFYNVSQDFRMAPAIRDSKVQGSTFAWYPTQLMNQRTLRGNHLPFVDRYEQMHNPDLEKKGKIVYEFGSPDMMDSYMFPAMVREFRAGGIQFANYFSYDMLATAYANLGWQTHFLNMVYTPHKAVSAIIAGKAMHELPRFKSYGYFPQNNTFGNFKVNYDQKLSEYISDSVFLYSNNTLTLPPYPESLQQIVGCGSSPVVDYEGEGIYFLDKIEDGLWKLEVYPDAVIINDPFEQVSPQKVVSRILYREWPMKIVLPDLGKEFTIQPINKGNTFQTSSDDSRFLISPGIYFLSNEDKDKSISRLVVDTESIRFISPEAQDLPLQVIHEPVREFLLENPCEITARVICSVDPNRITCYVRNAGELRFKTFEMTRKRGYLYHASIPPDAVKPGLIEYCIAVEEFGEVKTFPGGMPGEPSIWAGGDDNWDFILENLWESQIVGASAPMMLFDAKDDRDELNFTRIFKSTPYNTHYVNGFTAGSLALQIEIPDFSQKEEYEFPPDISYDHFIGEKVKMRGSTIGAATSLKIRARATRAATSRILVSLINKDGIALGSEVPLSMEWKEIELPLSNLKPVRAVMLPQDWPGVNSYWYQTESINNPVDKIAFIEGIEKIQVSIREDLFQEYSNLSHGFEVECISMVF